MNSKENKPTNNSTPASTDGGFELAQEVSHSAHKLRADSKLMESGINPYTDKLVTKKMDLGVGEPKQQFIDRAESCHARYQSRKHHRSISLQTMYKRMGQPENLVVMMYCKDFFPLFENWLASCDKHKVDIRQQLITFTLDPEANEKTRKLGINTYFLDPATYMPAGGSAKFGDREFANTMFYKNAIVREALQLGANVLFQDADMLWLRDPFDYFAEEGRNRDFYIMYDGNNRLHAPLYANTGFFYARCTDACKALFDTATHNTASIFSCRSHQRVFNRILAHFYLHNVLPMQILPQELFLNGHLFSRTKGVKDAARNWAEEGYVVHYSWTATRQEKREKIEKFGFNYLPGDRLLKELA